ncbi:MAG: DUF5683 domain-containing protein [Bacteroidota bacterium]|jgi:hypothetical protein
MKYFIYIAIIGCCLLPAKLWAQAGPINDSSVVGNPVNFSNTNSESVSPNSLKNQPSADTIQRHSPRKATLLSMALPGAGQIYNRKYWKAPLVYVAGGAAIYSILFYNKEYNGFKEAYAFRVTNGFNEEEFYNQFQTPTLKSYRDYYRYYRDLSYIALGAVYILQVVDAAVDAHFYDFKITEDLTLNVMPTVGFTQGRPNHQLSFALRF